VYASGIRLQRHEGTVGDLAVLFDRNDRFMGVGLFDPASPIRIRVLHCGEPQRIDIDWLAGRVRAASDRRQPLRDQATTGFRLIHGANDGLPGLVVDRYASTIVLKLYSAAWFPHLDNVLVVLRDVISPDRMILRLSRTVQAAAAGVTDRADGEILHGTDPSGPVMFQENGLRFEADPVRGHKTGFFFDQRDNRASVSTYCAGRSVLDAFAYTGGFSVYAARAGARSVVSLDASAPALAAAGRNLAHNHQHAAIAAVRHRVVQGNAFEVMPRMRANGERYDVVVLDPPAFAQARDQVDRALHKYARLIRLGLDVLAPGGMLVAASCSGRVTPERFRDVLSRAAERAGRPVDIVQQTGHALDHPIGFPEGRYLTCIFAEARA
jgi:23S rRNA (cytosine1962-C5)-methyltransferase